MELADWVALATVLAGLASVGSLLVVAWQLRTLSRQTREQARQAQAAAEAIRASVYVGSMQSMVSIDQFLADRPRLRAELYGHRSGSRRDRQRQRVDAGAEMLLDLFQMVFANVEHLRGTDEVEGWRSYMTSLMRDSPSLRDFWRRNRDWYSRPVQEIFDGVGDQTQRDQTPPESSPGAG